MSIRTFILGLLILMLLPVAIGAGVGQLELAIWLALLVAWTAFFISNRRTA